MGSPSAYVPTVVWPRLDMAIRQRFSGCGDVGMAVVEPIGGYSSLGFLPGFLPRLLDSVWGC
jgi:hypothetical protein